VAEEEKTEQATPKRKEEAREEGQVGKSREIPSVLVLLTSLMLLSMWGPELGKSLMEAMRVCFNEIPNLQVENQDRAVSFLTTMALRVGMMLLPVFAAALIAALLGNYIQVGFLISAKAIMPKFSKIDPIKGIKRLLSIQSLAELFKISDNQGGDSQGLPHGPDGGFGHCCNHHNCGIEDRL
jgi:flagellar biosynthetic protein FlhB